MIIRAFKGCQACPLTAHPAQALREDVHDDTLRDDPMPDRGQRG
jgi:hypothetical protein